MQLKPGLYQHFKGAIYLVLYLVKHSETEQELVVYQALYGDKGLWARPLSMFEEWVTHRGSKVRRFSYCEVQSGVLEVATLNIQPGQSNGFEKAFATAQPIIEGARGYISHQLRRHDQRHGQYLLLVNWQTLEDHTEGFRGSDAYQQWCKLLHHFYVSTPPIEYYRLPLDV